MGSSQEEGSQVRVAPHDAQARGWLRGAIMLLPAIVFAFAYMVVLRIIGLFAPNWIRARAISIIRTWGRIILKMLGIRVEIHGLEHLEEPGPRILIFNHVNVFDLVVLSQVWDEGFSVIYKKEFHRIPVMGHLMRFFGMIPIDRSDRERAVRSMQEVGKTIREEHKRVLIAPEGTRSHDGRLGEFKRGPFHMALDTGAPMTPLIMRGIEDLVQGLRRPPRPGVIRVDLLAPVDTTDWHHSELEARIRNMRAEFLRYLEDGAKES